MSPLAVALPVSLTLPWSLMVLALLFSWVVTVVAVLAVEVVDKKTFRIKIPIFFGLLFLPIVHGQPI